MVVTCNIHASWMGINMYGCGVVFKFTDIRECSGCRVTRCDAVTLPNIGLYIVKCDEKVT